MLRSTIWVSAFILLGCNEEAEKKFGSAKIEMTENTSAELTQNFDATSIYSKPEYFGVKLIAVYLSSTRDESGHSPSESTIYIHPSCLVPVGEGDGTKSVTVDKEAHIGRCDIEGGGTSSNTTHDLIDLVVKDYVDLAQSSQVVNDAIAAQGFQVAEGTYKYVVVILGGASGGVGVGDQTDGDGTYSPGTVPNIKHKHADCVAEDSTNFCAYMPTFTTTVEEVDSF